MADKRMDQTAGDCKGVSDVHCELLELHCAVDFLAAVVDDSADGGENRGGLSTHEMYGLARALRLVGEDLKRNVDALEAPAYRDMTAREERSPDNKAVSGIVADCLAPVDAYLENVESSMAMRRGDSVLDNVHEAISELVADAKLALVSRLGEGGCHG